MPVSAVKHFHDDLNRRVDVPEHPSHQGINSVREGKAKFLGKGNDGIVFDTNDGNVAKVTTSVPYNLAYFRPHGHAISDARRQAELNNQAISEGHDLLLPQEFIEHGEKGFTIMPKVETGTDLSKEQILAYREKLRAFHDAGWRLNDEVQHGVDADGNIRIFDTGALEKIAPGADESSYGESQRGHATSLMRRHGHFDEETHSDAVRDYLADMQDVLQYNDDATQEDRVNPLMPHEWRGLNDAVNTLIENDSEELGFHLDDLRKALDRIEGQFPRIEPRGPAFTAKVNDPDADFWIQRRGGENTVGTPSKAYNKEAIGISVDPEQLDAAYAFYLFQHIQQNLGFWKQRARGTTNLVGINMRDVKELQDQVKPDEPPIPKGFEVIKQMRANLDEYESRTANRILDNRMLEAQQAFADMITEYEQYDEEDLPHDESLDAYIYDKDLFEQFVPDLDADELAALAFASYRSGVYRDEDTLKLAGFLVEPEELSYDAENGEAIRNILQKQNDAGLNSQGEPLKPGEPTADGDKYEPMTNRFTDQDADEFMRNQYPEGYSWNESGFLLNDGTLLDMSHGSGTREDDHRSIIPSEAAAARWGFTPDGQGYDEDPNGFSRWARLQELLYRARAIRIDGNAGLINAQQMPTTQQWQSIAQWIKDFDPEYAAITLGDIEWNVDHPTVGLLMRQFESVADGINPGDEGWPGDEFDDDELDQYAAGISKPKTYEYPDTGEHQQIAPSHKQKQTQQSYEESKKSQDVAIDAKNLEPYKYEEPASPPEPNQDAQNQLRKAYEETTGEEAPEKSSTIAERMRQNRKLYDESDDSGKQLWANYANIDMEKIDELHQSAHPHLFDYVTGHEDDEYLYHVTPSINAEAIGKEGLRANQDQVAAAEANRHDIAGNVYLSEKSDLSKWMDYFHNVQIDSAGDMAYTKQEELDELSEQLLQHEPGSEEHATMQSQIESVQSEKEHFEKLEIAENYDDTVSVFRVPKKLVQNYLTKDTGPQDAGGAYKLNQHVQKMTKQSIELKGKFDRELINTNNDFRYLAEKRDELRAKVKKSEMLASDAQQESLRSANDAYEKYRYWYDDEFIVEVEKAISNLKDWRYGKRPGTFNNILEPWMASSDNSKRYAAMDYNVFVRLANEHTENTSDLELYMDAHGKQMQSQLADIAKAQVENMKLEVATNPNYWRWNRGGVALDDNGLPLVIFHGTWRGGFDEFGKSDVGTQVWGSTNVRMASSYAGGYRDDASPTIAGDIAEMRSMIATAARYTIGPHEDGEIYFSEVGAPGGKTKPILKAANYDEMLVKFNNWLLDQKEPTHGLNKRGVYPLVYRLENPLTFDAGGERWNEIYAFPEYDDYVTGAFLAKHPGTRALLDGKALDNVTGEDAVYGDAMQYLWDLKNKLDDGQPLSDPLGNMKPEEFAKKRSAIGRGITHMMKLKNRDYASVLDILMEALPELSVEDIFVYALNTETVIRTRDIASIAEKQGHDGVIIKNVVDYGGELDSSEFDDLGEEEIYTPNDVYVAFQYDQVKSAHNRTAFSESPDEAKRLSYQATA